MENGVHKISNDARGRSRINLLDEKKTIVLLPIGGGGLASGMALAIHALNPSCRLIGVEAEGAPNMFESFKLGEI